MTSPAFRAFIVAVTTALVLGLPLSVAALDPARRMADYAHDSWQMTDGLPHDTVSSIVQTRDGYLWLGTLDGLARFDGVRFETINLIRAAGIESNVVNALVEDRDGILWIGTASGLVRYHEGRFTTFDKRHGLSDASIRTIYKSRDGSLWIGTRWGGVNRFFNGRFTALGVAEGLLANEVLGVAEDASGTLWVSTMAGLNSVRAGVVSAVSFEGRGQRMLTASVYVDRHDTVWIGTIDGIWALSASERSVPGRPLIVRRHVLATTAGRAFFEDQDGSIWVGVGSGLVRVRGESVEVSGAELLSFANVRSFACDHEGSLWVGTDGGGLNRLRNASVVMVTNPSADPHASVMVIHRDPAGAMWTGANCGGITKWDGGRTTTFTVQDGLPSNCVRSFASAPDGALWVGTTEGVARLKDGRFTTYTTADGLSNNRVMAIAIDRAGTAWIGTSVSGINRFADGRFTHYNTKNGLGHDDVRAILVARDDTVWIGTLGGGLTRWRHGQLDTLNREHGLSSNNVLALREDSDGTLWVGTNGGGLDRLRTGVFTHYSTANGLFSDGIFQILDDAKGNLWMSGTRGIFRVSRQDLEDVGAGRRPSVTSEWFGRAEGLKPAGAMGGAQPAGAIDPSGQLWFPTIAGVAVIDPHRLVRNRMPPQVHIARVTVDGTVMTNERLAAIAPGSRTIDIDYAGLSFLAPGKARFRYRLEGFSESWVDIGSRRTVYFTGLRPGQYRFVVAAANNDGVWSDINASVTFTLLPHFYETPLFYAGCSALALALLFTAFRVRVGRLRARERELSQQVEHALTEIKVLSGLLPICASCKQIRNADQSWMPIEQYIHDHSQASFSHSICPDCMKKLYPDI